MVVLCWNMRTKQGCMSFWMCQTSVGWDFHINLVGLWLSLCYELKIAIPKVFVATNYVALTCDKVTTIDNGPWISIHAYVVQNWSRVPYMISLQKVEEGSGSYNLIIVIMGALRGDANMERLALAKTLLCLGANGVSTFQGPKTWVTLQIHIKYVSVALSVHCMAHHCNLAFKTLSKLDIISHIEGLSKSSHAYFKHSPKRHLEFIEFAKLMETKGLKLLKYVKAQRVSLIKPLKRIIQEYKFFFFGKDETK